MSNIPKTTKFTLKRIIENLGNIPKNGFGEETKTLTPEQKQKLIEMASKFTNFGECLKNEESLMNSAQGITELCELAETYALNECGDYFQQEIVKKDMKELKKRVGDFQKITKEAYARLQQLGVVYEDIGHVLGRYYDLTKAVDPNQQGQAFAGGKGDDSVQKTVMEGDVVCSWCNGTIKKDSTSSKNTTHGMCDACFAQMKSKIPKKDS